MNAAVMPTAADYARIFETECAQTYPVIDVFEQRCGYAVDLARLSAAARVLACPIKDNPPNWQHGRVLYSVARRYFESTVDVMNVLDIGTAKGFSALCLQWAMTDAGRQGTVVSVDVLDPNGTERRNTVAELNGPVTLAQILAPWPEAQDISFLKATGIYHLHSRADRIHVAFVDGKHTGDGVMHEGEVLSERQITGDVVVFDDYQMPDVAYAVRRLQDVYETEKLTAKTGRSYVIARRR